MIGIKRERFCEWTFAERYICDNEDSTRPTRFYVRSATRFFGCGEKARKTLSSESSRKECWAVCLDVPLGLRVSLTVFCTSYRRVYALRDVSSCRVSSGCIFADVYLWILPNLTVTSLCVSRKHFFTFPVNKYLWKVFVFDTSIWNVICKFFFPKSIISWHKYCYIKRKVTNKSLR